MRIKTFQEFIFEGVDLDLAKEEENQAKIREQMKKLDASKAKIDATNKKPSEKTSAKALITQSYAILHANLAKSKAKQSRLEQTMAKTM